MTKHKLFAAAILLSLLLGLTINAQKQTATKAWEYHVEPFNSWGDASHRLNELGNEGWELVAVTERTDQSPSVAVYLKRAK
jgi:hypothetical protein